MFEQHFGLRENPFAAGHQSRFVYPSREHQEALAHLRFGIENREPFVLITGEVGTGKTTALYDVLAEYESRAVVALITNSSLTRDELLEEICLRFGLSAGGHLTKPQAVVALERFLRQTRAQNHHAILILDEAQNLERDLLEEIRLLSNLEDSGQKLIQLFLVGQPELEDKLSRPELRQLRQRITVFYRLSPLSADDTEQYIHHRIAVAGGHALTVFPSAACREVHAITHGIPREINTVAGKALLNAFVEDSPSVRPEHVRLVERDTEFKSVLRGAMGGARISTLDSQTAPAAPASAPQQPAPAVHATAPVTASPSQAQTPTPTPTAAREPAPAPVTPGPPPLHPVEPVAPVASVAPAAGGTPVASAASAPAPSPPGPPPLHPAAEVAPAPNAAPTPIASGPPPLHPAEPPAKPGQSTPAGGPGAPKKPGGVAPAGDAQSWGTWLTSLSQLPSVFDEEEAAASADEPPAPQATQQAAAASASQSAPAPAQASAPAAPLPGPPARSEAATPAGTPPRAEATARTEPAASPAPRTEPPRRPEAPARSEQPARQARPEQPARTEAPARASAPPRPEEPASAAAPPRAEPARPAEPVARAEAAAPPASAPSSSAPAAPASPAPTPAAAAPPRVEIVTRTEEMELASAVARAKAKTRDEKAAPGKPQFVPEWSQRTPRRLEFLDEEPSDEGSKALRWLVLAGLIGVIVVGGALGVRAWLNSTKSTQAEPTSAVTSPATVSPATTSQPVTSSETAAESAKPSPTAATRPAHSKNGAVAGATAASGAATAAPKHHVAESKPAAPAPAVTPSSAAAPAEPASGDHGTPAVVGGAAVAGGAAAAAGGGAPEAGGAASGAAAGGATAGGAAAGGASAGAASASPAAPAHTKPGASAQGAYGLAVGTFLNEDRANQERDKLVASTKLPAQVISVTENGDSEYRLVLGSFETRSQAEKMASSLIERGLVDEARVVPLGGASAAKQ